MDTDHPRQARDASAAGLTTWAQLLRERAAALEGLAAGLKERTNFRDALAALRGDRTKRPQG